MDETCALFSCTDRVAAAVFAQNENVPHHNLTRRRGAFGRAASPLAAAGRSGVMLRIVVTAWMVLFLGGVAMHPSRGDRPREKGVFRRFLADGRKMRIHCGNLAAADVPPSARFFWLAFSLEATRRTVFLRQD